MVTLLVMKGIQGVLTLGHHTVTCMMHHEKDQFKGSKFGYFFLFRFMWKLKV